MKKPIKFMNNAFYLKLINKISTHALNIFHAEYLKAKHETRTSPLSECTGTHSVIFGIPCSHQIKTMINLNSSVDINHFHEIWHLRNLVCKESDANSIISSFTEGEMLSMIGFFNSQKIPSISNPDVVITKGRPKNSTRRDPSGFEYVEPPMKSRKCGTCFRLGHNSVTCNERKENNATKPLKQKNPMICIICQCNHHFTECPLKDQNG